jgi:predicted nucleotidyltransferase
VLPVSGSRKDFGMPTDNTAHDGHRPGAPTRERVLALISRRSADLKRLGVRRLALFGSVLRHEASDRSDIDLLVEFEPGLKTYDNFIRTASLLEELLGGSVDLVTREGLSPFIGPRILREMEDVPLGD